MTTPSFLRGGRAGVEPALDHLFTDLTHPESSIRAAAVYTLGQYGDQAATVARLRVLSDPDAIVREEAAYALGCLEDVGALAGLLVACYDKDTGVRRIIRYQGCVSGRRTVNVLPWPSTLVTSTTPL